MSRCLSSFFSFFARIGIVVWIFWTRVFCPRTTDARSCAVLVLLQAPDQLKAYAVWIVAETGSRLAASCTAPLLPVRLRRFWKVDAVGALVRAGANRTIALPQGCALLGTSTTSFVDKTAMSSLHCVSWGYVDVSLRVAHIGDAEGATGVSKVSAHHMSNSFQLHTCVPHNSTHTTIGLP